MVYFFIVVGGMLGGQSLDARTSIYIDVAYWFMLLLFAWPSPRMALDCIYIYVNLNTKVLVALIAFLPASIDNLLTGI